MPHRMPEFDHHGYTMEQVIEALTCPVNRHATRVQHSCNDYELFKNPQWLLDNYIHNGGAEGFARRRDEYRSLCEHIETCWFGEVCELALTRSRYSMCPLRHASVQYGRFICNRCCSKKSRMLKEIAESQQKPKQE